GRPEHLAIQPRGCRSDTGGLRRVPGKNMRYLIVILGLVALVGGLVAIKGAQIGMLIGMGKAMQKAGPPPEVVSTASAQEQIWENTLTAVASVVTAKGVALSNDAPGIVA